MGSPNAFHRNAMQALRAVTDAVVSELRNGINSGYITLPGVEPQRIYDTELPLEENVDMSLDLVMGDVDMEMADRLLRMYTCRADIVLRKRVDPYSIGLVDQLLDSAGEVLDVLCPSDAHSEAGRSRQLSALPEAYFLKADIQAPYIPDHLRSQQQFTCVLSVYYVIYG